MMNLINLINQQIFDLQPPSNSSAKIFVRLQDTATSDCHTTQTTYIHNTFYVIKLSDSSSFLLINLATVNVGGH